MKKNILFLFIFVASLNLFSFPINDYDFHLAELQISPITAAMGGLNVISIKDPFAVYQNPAILGEVEQSVFSISFKMKNKEDQNITDIINAGNILKEKQISFINLSAKKAGFSFQPLVSIHEKSNYFVSNVQYQDYIDYKLNSYQVSGGFDKNEISWGFTAKFLSGRLIYLKEKQIESTELFNIDSFIDDNSKGFSFDLGFIYTKSNIKYGLVFYDLFSHLYWKNNPNRTLTKRFAFGTGYSSNGYDLTAGIDGKLNKNSNSQYHFGIAKNVLTDENPNNPKSLDFRAGVYSHDFKNEDDIFTSFGVGYFIKIFKIDCSVTSFGMNSENNSYLISTSIAM